MATQTPEAGSTTLRTAAVVGAVAAVGILGAKKASAAVNPPLKFSDIPGTGDVHVLNYALALEQLEADLYAQAVQRLTTGGTNALGTTIPGLGLATSLPDVNYVIEFGKVEAEHRDFLTAALGSAGIKPFKYDFGMQSLSRQGVINIIYTAEALGVSAYLGGIQYLATRRYLQIAGAILGTEARHTAVVAELSDLLFGTAINVAPLANQNNGRDTPNSPDTVLATVSPYIVT